MILMVVRFRDYGLGLWVRSIGLKMGDKGRGY